MTKEVLGETEKPKETLDREEVLEYFEHLQHSEPLEEASVAEKPDKSEESDTETIDSDQDATTWQSDPCLRWSEHGRTTRGKLRPQFQFLGHSDKRSTWSPGGYLCDKCYATACRTEGWTHAGDVTPTGATDDELAQGAAGIPGGPDKLNSESEDYPEGYLDDPQAFREKLLAAEAEASMHQTDAGINNEELLAQDLQPEEVVQIEDTLVNTLAVMEEFADWAMEEVFNDSSSESLQEGGYEDPRLSPTREPSTGWPENTPQSIRVADAEVIDPDLKHHSENVDELSEVVLQQKFFCTKCASEVSAQKDLHHCSTCQAIQCKT
jgi:hypothetical protein